RALWFVALAAAAGAAGVLFARAYRGDPVVYRSFRAGLLPSTVVASLCGGVLLVGSRAASLSRGQERLALAGVAIAAAGAAACAFTTSAAVLALFLPAPTLGLAAATLAGRGRALPAAGLVGLALADVAALLGLVLLVRRTDSTLLGTGGAPAVTGWLLMGAAAVKAGAVPWVGTWGAGEGVPAARLAQLGVRAQGVVLAAIVAVSIRPQLDDAVLAGAAAGLAVACGLSALAPGRGLAGVSGLAPCVIGVAAALGGGVGVQAIAVLLPVLPLMWGAAWMLSVAPDQAAATARGSADAPPPRWGRAATVALGVALATLALVPLLGAFPGAFLVIVLAATRASGDPSWLVPMGSLLAAAAMGMAGAVRALRDVVPGRHAFAGIAVALGSLYAGLASGPLAVGWLIRVRSELGVAAVLPSAGAPVLPPAGAVRFALAAAPALVLVGAVVALTRGARPPGPVPRPAPPRARAPARPALGISPRDQVRFVVAFAIRAALGAAGLLRRVRATGAGWAAVGLAEALAVVLIARVVLDAAGRGFL
ncbi:MAG: hypothetical protein LC708_02775, partial [Actinobacteria bacterium]|nr:hypothetical protein [Actinomycetota bacterium]